MIETFSFNDMTKIRVLYLGNKAMIMSHRSFERVENEKPWLGKYYKGTYRIYNILGITIAIAKRRKEAI